MIFRDCINAIIDENIQSQLQRTVFTDKKLKSDRKVQANCSKPEHMVKCDFSKKKNKITIFFIEKHVMGLALGTCMLSFIGIGGSGNPNIF